MIETIHELVELLTRNNPDDPVEVNLDGYNFKIEKVEMVDQYNDIVRIHLETRGDEEQ